MLKFKVSVWQMGHMQIEDGKNNVTEKEKKFLKSRCKWS